MWSTSTGESDLASEAVDSPDPPQLRIQLFFFLSSANSLRPPHFLLRCFFIAYYFTMGPGSKKRKLNSKVEEVNFDDTARYDFLTGFRKRKQQRIKHAQSVAEKRAREERIEDRKRVTCLVTHSR